MTSDAKFEGWVGLDKESAKGNLIWQSYEPKKFEETDVDVSLTPLSTPNLGQHS